MIGMDQYELIRTAHRVYGKSIREIRRETGHHRETIRKALQGLEPKYRRREPPRCPVMDPVAPIIEGWLLGDRDRPRRQRHTSRRIWNRLVEENGFGGAESTVRRWVREWKAAHGYGGKQAVVPLEKVNNSSLMKHQLRQRWTPSTGPLSGISKVSSVVLVAASQGNSERG